MSDIVKQVKNFYNQAGEYFSRTRQKSDEAGNATWMETRDFIERINDGDRVLDLGCGNGRLLTGIDKDIDYLGVDFSKVLLSEAKKLHPDEKFILGDLTKKDVWGKIEDGGFDAVFSVAFLHHVPKRSQQKFVLEKINKKMKDDGFLYLTVWNLWQKDYVKYHKQKTFDGKNSRWLEIPFKNKWQRFCFLFDKQYMVELLSNSGFKIKDIFYSDGVGGVAEISEGKNLVVFAKKAT